MSKNKPTAEEVLKSIKDQVKTILKTIDKVEDINPDTEFTFAGNDIYISHVQQSFEELMEIIGDAEKGAKPTYSEEWSKEFIQEVKDNNSDE